MVTCGLPGIGLMAIMGITGCPGLGSNLLKLGFFGPLVIGDGTEMLINLTQVTGDRMLVFMAESIMATAMAAMAITAVAGRGGTFRITRL